MSDINRHFKELNDYIDTALISLVERFPNDTEKIQTEVSRLCERLMSSWMTPNSLSQSSMAGSEGQSWPSGRMPTSESSDSTTSEDIVTHDNGTVIVDGPEARETTPKSSTARSIGLSCPRDKHLNGLLASDQLHRLRNETFRPAALLAHLHEHLPAAHRSCAPLLVRLFYAIGSPESFYQLRDACRSIRNTPLASRPTSTGTSELATTVQALDALEDNDRAAAILRRYYLTRLLSHRNACAEHHQRLLRESRFTKFKHGHIRVRPVRKGQGQTRAASTALDELSAEAYPQLHDPDGRPLHAHRGAHKRARESLKRRLTNARNWLALSEAFSPGIFSLIPTGGDFSIYNHQIETIQPAPFRIFLSILSTQRGTFLRSASTMLCKGIFEILRGERLDQLWYTVENYTEEVCGAEEFDSFAFVMGCTSRAAEDYHEVPRMHV